MVADPESRRDDLQLAEHNELWNAVTDASEALFRSRMMGILGSPQLIAECEDALENARLRLSDWEQANHWHVNLVEPEAAELARRIAIGN